MNIQLKDVDNVVFNGIDISAVKFNTVLVWQKWETIEYTGAVPVEITANGEPLIDYLVKGNMQQSGTPTPQNPIQPQETGDKTANLLDNILVSTTYDGVTVILNPDKSITVNGTLETVSQALFRIGTVLFENGESYTISGVTGYTSITMQMFTESNTAFPRGNRLQCFDGAITRTALGDETCDVNLYIYGGAVFDNVKIYPFICKGSTALPYEPYGYKLPFVSGDTTTPIYLEEVPTTRKIKKLVLTGEENITLYTIATGNLYRITLPALRILGQFSGNGMCTHYRSVMRSADRINGTISGGDATTVQGVVDIVDDYATVADFKAYLAAQYANGTPVTVWYILANETTGIVNEPLRKIGSYVDTISAEQAQVQIPTVSGVNVVDIDTTLKPSSIYLKYKGKS